VTKRNRVKSIECASLTILFGGSGECAITVFKGGRRGCRVGSLGDDFCYMRCFGGDCWSEKKVKGEVSWF